MYDRPLSETELTCSDCFYCSPLLPNGALECRMLPIKVHLDIHPNPIAGGQPIIVKASGYPNCKEICGQFEPKNQQPQTRPVNECEIP